jgi:hypothetical protein
MGGHDLRVVLSPWVDAGEARGYDAAAWATFSPMSSWRKNEEDKAHDNDKWILLI